MYTVDITKTPLYELEMEGAEKKATFESAKIMLEKFKISIDDIVKELNIKKEEFLEYIQKQEKS